MKSAFSGWRYLWKSEDIRRKLLITLGILALYRLAANVPVPGVDFAALKAFRSSGAGTGGFLGFLDLLSGGTVSNFSLLSMGVYPYITAQIILQLLIPIIPALQRRMQEDPREGRQWMERWTYFLAVPMAALSAIGQINIFNSLSVQALNQVILPFGFSSSLWLESTTVLLAMTAGTMFAIWLGELISEYGIRGQGLSLVIFAGIVARMPANLARLLADPATALFLMVFTLIVIVLVIFAIVFVQQGRRNVPVMYPGRRMGSRMSMPVKGTLPLMVNLAGMIPLIFASAILQFPAIIASYFTNSSSPAIKNFALGVQSTLGRHRHEQLGVLVAVLPDGCLVHILLYLGPVRAAELWRQPEEGRGADPGSARRRSDPEVSQPRPAAHHAAWRRLPGHRGCHALRPEQAARPVQCRLSLLHRRFVPGFVGWPADRRGRGARHVP